MLEVETVGSDKELEIFALGSQWITKSRGLRLDAGYYNPRAAQAITALQQSGIPLRRLGDEDITERIFVPARFKRIYVTEQHGVPFLQGSHLVHFQPADLKYLSRKAHKSLSQWIIKKGWVLVTCSGTIGRVTIALDSWDGWAASQHIMRIIPRSGGPCPAGYIYAFLSSPLGQAQFNGVYGAVVDELTAEDAGNILIPVPENQQQKAIIATINELSLESIREKEKAVHLAEQAVARVNEFLPNLSPS